MILMLVGAARAEVLLEAPGKLDLAYMQQQTARIDELAARQMGLRLRQTRADLSLLQSLLDRMLIKPGDDAGLQAMGIALGNVLAAEYHLDWVIYQDQRGRSRALLIGPDQQCLFPSTMISRRANAGAQVDVLAIYEKAGQTVRRLQTRGIKPY